MCVQVDQRWSCGHIGYLRIKFCEKLFKGCKGTSAQHEFEHVDEKCSDCVRRETLPEPFESK